MAEIWRTLSERAFGTMEPQCILRPKDSSLEKHATEAFYPSEKRNPLSRCSEGLVT